MDPYLNKLKLVLEGKMLSPPPSIAMKYSVKNGTDSFKIAVQICNSPYGK
jgi:hypothetical protein